MNALFVSTSAYLHVVQAASAVIFRQFQMNVSECHELHLHKTEMSENLPGPRCYLFEWVVK